MERACYRTRTDVAVDDDARAMEEINYPISICCVAVDRYSRASLGASEREKLNKKDTRINYVFIGGRREKQ